MYDRYAGRRIFICSEKPHYVDWLAERLLFLQLSELSGENTVQEITTLIAQTKCWPGKASVAFVVSDDQLYHYSTLGDTRICWPQENSRTQDHSVAQLAVQRGECPPDQLRFHPYRNRLMRHAGAGTKHLLAWQTRSLTENECLILCSDGLWSQLDDRHIYSVTDKKDLAKLVEHLVTVPPPDNLCRRRDNFSYQGTLCAAPAQQHYYPPQPDHHCCSSTELPTG